MGNNVPGIERLIDHGNLDPNALNMDGQTALQIGAENVYISCVEALLKRGHSIDVNTNKV